jgi:hypothetical protein
MHNYMPEPLSIDKKARALMKWHSHLSRRIRQAIIAAIHEDHVGIWVVGEFYPRPDYPTIALRIESIVVVAV